MCGSRFVESMLAAVVAITTAASSVNSACAQAHPTMTKDDIDRLVQEVSNWGRWGADDQLGALNLITPAKRVAAAQLVKEGLSVSLAHPVIRAASADNPFPFQHTMLANGRDDDGPWAMDNYSVAYHGFAHTHMDALCHLFYNGRMYNGFQRAQVGPSGAEALGIDNVRSGVFTRGVLFDIPRLRGERFLEPGTPIYPEELSAWEEQAGLKVQPGDVVFIYTGRWARRAITGPWDVSKEGAAGLHASCAKWLKERDIAMLGSDGASDVLPSGIQGVDHPVHALMLHAMGTPIFDNCDLEAAAETAVLLNRWEFLITASPLVVPGGTGSPLNPIATF